jgi:hypothetical protein
MKIYAIILGAFLLILGAYGAYQHHVGYVSGNANGDKRVAEAEAKEHAAEASNAVLVATMREINSAKADAEREADEALKRATEAVARADAAKVQADRDAAAFVKQLHAAAAKPECLGLKENLCSSVPFPY